ncbi:MAG: (2Fe-2S)-binding protein [Gemmatimonadales bacterium]
MSARPPRLRITMCVCKQREFAELLPLARANGWGLEALATATGCGLQCGLCRPYLRRMLATGETVFNEILVEVQAEQGTGNGER